MEWLPLVGSAVLIGLGGLGLLAPRAAAALVGIRPDGPAGVSEIRVTYGALFAGLGASALYFRDETVFVMLGLVSALSAIVRALSLWPDRSVSAKSIAGIASEAGLAVLFLAVLI